MPVLLPPHGLASFEDAQRILEPQHEALVKNEKDIADQGRDIESQESRIGVIEDHLSGWRTMLPVEPEGIDTSWSTSGGYRFGTSTSAQFDMHLDVPLGQVLNGVRFNVFGNGTDSIFVALEHVDAETQTRTELVRDTFTPSAAWEFQRELDFVATENTGGMYLTFFLDTDVRIGVIQYRFGNG